MCDRFDDELRDREKPKTITLSDGSTFTHKHIFNTFINSGFKEKYMKEAIYRLITDKPFSIEISNKEYHRKIDVESLFKKRPFDLSRAQEVHFVVDGVESNSSDFFQVLQKNGECIRI